MRLALVLPLLLAACNGAGKPDDTGGDTGGPQEGWCAVQAIFNDSCVACHSASGQSGGLDLETDAYAAIVDQASSAYAGRTLVVPGNPDASFLYLKMSDQQGADGAVMPPNGALDAATLAVVSDWILQGASDVCTSPDTGPIDGYHPDGWDDPTAHGMAAKFQEDDCLACHGDDLGGGKVGISCDDCHDAGWRTDCTFCHGGTDDPSGAPPQDIDDGDTDLSFPEHTVHVTETIHAAFDCVECHQKPTDPLTAGHLFVGDATPGLAELSFAASLSDRGAYGAGTCSNLYCHGNGLGDNGEVSSGESLDCDGCHPDATSGQRGWDEMSGRHDDHLGEGVACGECHSLTASGDSTIVGPSYHVNGVKEVALPSTMTRSGNSCSGTCHGERHDSRSW